MRRLERRNPRAGQAAGAPKTAQIGDPNGEKVTPGPRDRQPILAVVDQTSEDREAESRRRFYRFTAAARRFFDEPTPARKDDAHRAFASFAHMFVDDRVAVEHLVARFRHTFGRDVELQP